MCTSKSLFSFGQYYEVETTSGFVGGRQKRRTVFGDATKSTECPLACAGASLVVIEHPGSQGRLLSSDAQPDRAHGSHRGRHTSARDVGSEKDLEKLESDFCSDPRQLDRRLEGVEERRRRYVRFFVRLPQIDMAHQDAERFLERSKNA
jgi:hypothetical protein